ncbi:MAG: SDR family oxidoreductase [Endomicrobium sp.]|jgi:NAD(P)-dependent dehydrogenase (short-subunit alcohol dehydrogenase family)|nr:SDR family oxidoreductase [Endomicrobium sp.]
MFKGKTAVITGGAGGIGKGIAERFKALGANSAVIDTAKNDYFTGDIADKTVLDKFASKVINEFGSVDFLINNAPPAFRGIDSCTYEEFENALRVGVTAPFYLASLFNKHFAAGASIINISSSRDRQSQPNSESYAAAKGGISALTHALAVSLAGRVRVNSISPGWINTTDAVFSGADALQQPAGRVGRVEDIAEAVMFLCSDKAGFITGENICIDGGMTRQMIYHGDFGWSLKT